MLKAIGFVLASGLLLTITGCSEVSGTVRDVETSAPIGDAEVGLVIQRPFAFFPTFREETRTATNGTYRFVHTDTQPRVYVRVPGYLTQIRSVATSPEVQRDFQMRSIESLLGEWNVTLNIAGVVLGETRFEFDENGIQWFSELGFLGDIDFSFDGNNVAINSLLAIGGDIIAGEMVATLALDASGTQLLGEVDFNHSFFGGTACQSGCGGTLIAVRIEN